MGTAGKHSSRQIEEMIDRVERLYGLRVQEHLADFPDDLLRRHARRLASRPPSAGALIREPVRSIETACFLRYCLLNATDRLLMMVRRRVADLWRRAAIGADAARPVRSLLSALVRRPRFPRKRMARGSCRVRSRTRVLRL